MVAIIIGAILLFIGLGEASSAKYINQQTVFFIGAACGLVLVFIGIYAEIIIKKIDKITKKSSDHEEVQNKGGELQFGKFLTINERNRTFHLRSIRFEYPQFIRYEVLENGTVLQDVPSYTEFSWKEKQISTISIRIYLEGYSEEYLTVTPLKEKRKGTQEYNEGIDRLLKYLNGLDLIKKSL